MQEKQWKLTWFAFLPILPIFKNFNTSAGDVAAADVPLSTKKRVRFGAPLTPELFDMMLPPSTPLQRGGTPAHVIASAGPQLRSLLKTPHRSPQRFPQPDFGSPSVTRGAPAGMRFDQMEHNGQDDEVQILTGPYWLFRASSSLLD